MKAVRAKKGDGKGSTASPATVAPETAIAPEAAVAPETAVAPKSPTAASAVAPAPAPPSAIDAFAAFLAKDALNPAHRDEPEAEDSKVDKPAKKPRAGKAAGRVKKA